jgi:predicted alpha/beta-fold hydrolase
VTSDAIENRAVNKAKTGDLKTRWWLANGHAQTLYRKFSSAPDLEHSRQRVELSDGDFIDIDWALKPDDGLAEHKKIVLILHGLCGCSRSSYVLSLQSLLVARGVSSVAMNFRGCSGESNRLARSYHSGVTEDLREVLCTLLEHYPEHEIFTVGYSLGANVLLKYLGEEGKAAQCSAAVAVSTPFRLADCSRAMLSGLSGMYGRYFVNRLKVTLDDKMRALESAGNRAELERMHQLTIPGRFASVWEFDDLITAPLHGFASAEDYYERCSSSAFLSSIKTPTLLLQSMDDPIIPATSLPAVGTLPAGVRFQLTERGGHVGFVAARESRWLEEQIYTGLFG